MKLNDNQVSIYIEVIGNILGGINNQKNEPNTDTIRVFIDVDLNAGTGYTINGLGADHMIEVYGQFKDKSIVDIGYHYYMSLIQYI